MKKNRFWLGLTAAFGLINYMPLVALAVEQAAQSAADSEALPLESVISSGTIYYTGFFRALLSLAIVIALIYLTAWVYKKLNNFNSEKLIKNDKKINLNKFKLISTQPLGANKNLHVVEINGKYLVIGSTANNISLIKEFDKILIDNSDDNNALREMINTAADENTEEKQSGETSVDTQLKDILDKYKE